jgi:hypothetical protein
MVCNGKESTMFNWFKRRQRQPFDIDEFVQNASEITTQ